MKFPFWDGSEPQGALKGTLRDEILEELCDRKQTCLLATPYLSLESRFLERSEGELHVRANMNQEAARHSLQPYPLKVRFPWALTFYCGQTRLLGYQQEAERRYFRIAIPEVLELDELREAHRLERAGRCQGALSAEDGAIQRISLENISRLGAGVHCLGSLPVEGFQLGRTITISLPLEEGPNLKGPARVIHVQGHYLGMKFEAWPDSVVSDLRQWMEPRVEEAKRHWENRAAIRAKLVETVKPKSLPSGVLLLSGDAVLPERIAEALEGLFPLRTCPPNLASFREALATPPLLILVDPVGATLDERHRLRGLFEAMAPACPVLVLGRGVDPDRWHALADELKANLFFKWNPDQSVFFRRLVRGLVQRQGNPGTA